MKILLRNFNAKGKFLFLNCTAILVALLISPCFSFANVTKATIRETVNDVPHQPSITLHIVQRESKKEIAHKAVALKCDAYGVFSVVHLGDLDNPDPTVNIKMRFNENDSTVEIWRWDPHRAVAFNTSEEAFRRFFGKQTLHVNLSADSNLMNSIEGNFSLARFQNQMKEFQKKCEALGWTTTKNSFSTPID